LSICVKFHFLLLFNLKTEFGIIYLPIVDHNHKKSSLQFSEYEFRFLMLSSVMLFIFSGEKKIEKGRRKSGKCFKVQIVYHNISCQDFINLHLVYTYIRYNVGKMLLDLIPLFNMSSLSETGLVISKDTQFLLHNAT